MSTDNLNQNTNSNGNQPNSQPANGATRPEYIPEKFWDASTGQVRVEALAKSYAEAEKKISSKSGTSGSTEGSPSTTTLAIPAEPAKTAAAEPPKAVSKVLDGFVDEFANGNGQLSNESVAKITQAGISLDDAKEFLGLKVKQRQDVVNDVTSVVGGKENADKLLKWAGAIPEGERAVLNKKLASGDPDLQKEALTTIATKYEAVYGKDTAFVRGSGAASGSNGFTSKAEMLKAMNDPRYDAQTGDREYRRQVMQRIVNRTFKL